MGRKNDREQGIRRGQTIVAERERVKSEAERLRVRKRKKRRKRRAVIVLSLLIAIAYLVGYTWLKEWSNDHIATEVSTPEYKIRAEVVDEDGASMLSARIEQYIALLEQDLADLGFIVTKFVLPTGASRELYIDLVDISYYFKVNMDRGPAETAEDITRMVKYLQSKNLQPEYVDVRIGGKAYYK